MMRLPQIYSPSTAKEVKDNNATMNQKQNHKQNFTANNRPVTGTNLRKWPGRPPLLPNLAGSPISDVSPAQTIQKQTPLSPAGRTIDNIEDKATPVKSFLNSNITPRSSSRKARKDSASSTPNRTPNGTPKTARPISMIDQRERGAEDTYGASGLGIGSANAGNTGRASSVVSDGSRPTRSFRPTSRERNGYNEHTTTPESQPMFFRADDIRPNLASIPSERYVLQGKAPTEMHFGAEDDYGASRSPLGNSPPQEGPRSKFLYANSTAESTPATYRPLTESAVNSLSSALPQRATSPLKDEVLSRRSSLSMASPRRHKRLISNPTAARGQDIKIPEAHSMGQSGLSRRSSLSTPGQQKVSQVKSSGVSAVGSTAIRRSSIALSEGPAMKSPKLRPIVGAVEAQLPSPQTSDPPNTQSPSNSNSPRPGQSKLEHMNELAANARRERKVLDLEISNSSLLAINRTLEREMRKQAADLRRFRRLSRPDRVSAVPSLHSASNALTLLSKTDDHIDSDDYSGRSSPAFSLDDNDDDDDNRSDLSSSSNTSRPDENALSQLHFTRIRAKDSKRLHLDFSRHRTLLIESQKLNQSLKRCLSRTECLIADGKKALEYRVDVHSIENRGGRVLLPDELDGGGIGLQRQGLLSPGIREREEPLWERRGDKSDGEDEEGQIEEEDDRQSSREDETNAHAEIEPTNEWDRIKSDVQTPDELPGGVGHGLREYLSTLGDVWLPS